LIRINLTLCIVLFCSTLNADPLQSALSLNAKNQQQAANSQKQFDKLDDERKQMLQKYLQLQRRIALLSSDNAQLKTRLKAQAQSRILLQQQLAEIEVTRSGIMPLLEQMHSTLDEFVSHDLAFLPQERALRLQRLTSRLNRAEISDAERYQQILQAYQVELQYGRSIEVYQDILNPESDEAARSVNFFRLGRIGLYYLTLDKKEAAVLDSVNNQWTKLDDEQRSQLVRAMRIARQQSIPGFIHLPLVVAKEAAQ